MMLASVRKSERALSLEPGFRVFMATLEVEGSKSTGTKGTENYQRLILNGTDRFLFLNKRQHQVTNVMM
jgi:hypothetical protein